jgi:2-phospho-L-lactate guanylyltransferase (CobY/MobA/RfbA family)
VNQFSLYIYKQLQHAESRSRKVKIILQSGTEFKGSINQIIAKKEKSEVEKGVAVILKDIPFIHHIDIEQIAAVTSNF